jgi:hypothetical protein
LGVTGTLGVVGAVTQTGGVISMLGSAASSITTAAGNLSLSAASALALGTTAGTVSIGRSGAAVALTTSALFQGGAAAQFSIPSFVENRVQGAYAGAGLTAMTNPEGTAMAEISGSTAIHISGSVNSIYKGGSEMVYLNGLLLLSGTGNDYHVTSSNSGAGLKMRTITLSSPLISGDVVQVKFMKFIA